MSIIVYPQFDWLKARLSVRTWKVIQEIASCEQITLSNVIYSHPEVVPRRWRALAAECFADDTRTWLTRRIDGLKRDLREAEHRLAKLK